MTSRMLAKKITDFALSKKASDVVMMDLRKLSAPSDFFVICSADSDTQVKAIADAVRDGSERIGVRPWHSEGFRALTWVLLDYVDVVVHVFKKEARSFYNLERLWGDAKFIPVYDETAPPLAAGIPMKRSARRTTRRRTRKDAE
ncbi:MAG: ribosome silencing factor [Bacteroidota bacterium]